MSVSGLLCVVFRCLINECFDVKGNSVRALSGLMRVVQLSNLTYVVMGTKPVSYTHLTLPTNREV